MSEAEKKKEISSRRLLKRIRDVMLQDISIQTKLDKIVYLVADELHTEVCSFYLLRPGDILELFATYGLSQDAVHETSLRMGEGLIGEIAVQKKPLSFPDAWHHPSFVFKPETGEKPFLSLMGVPVLQGSNLLGVLAVQTEEHYEYQEEEIEILETVAMLLAQILLSVEFKTAQNITIKTPKDMRARLEGVRLTSGMGLGHAYLHSRAERVTNLVSNNEAAELNKLNQALEHMDQELNTMLASPDISEENAEIFETYRMFTKDKGWIRKITDYIHTGLTAEAAVQKVGDDISERMKLMTDPYLKERVHDFQDLADRLQRHLSGKDIFSKNKDLPDDTILVAHSMGPAELLDYDRKKIKALVLEEGSPTMHVVIVAKSLNIPVVGGLKGITNRIVKGDVVAVDGDNGFIYINPIEDILKDFKNRIAQLEKIRRKYERLKNVPCQTLDGVPVSLNINAGLAMDMLALGDGFADGIGLYRTELPFLSTAQLPDTQKQIEIYKRALLNANGKPVVFRTLDVGSDKVLPYVQYREEENPAMGWRSIRITLDRRSLLRQQLRAFIRAVSGQDLYVMFPMVTDIDEFIAAKNTLQIELEREKEKGGILPSSIHVGTMLEVPSLLFQLRELLPLVDFVSVGTNDLSQFLFATDRSDPTIWERYDVLSSPMLRVLKYVADLCNEMNVPCSVCGEMAGKPLDAVALVALGFKRLSMNPSSLGAVKAAVLSMNMKEVQEYLLSILSSQSHSLREKLRLFAIDHDIVI